MSANYNGALATYPEIRVPVDQHRHQTVTPYPPTPRVKR